MRRSLIRVLVLVTLTSGTVYVGWRWLFSVNWGNWWIAVPLVLAETYSLIDAYLFGWTMWRLKQRGEPPGPPADATVDVFITTYNEPIELVQATAQAALAITHPHRTWVLDDGNREEMQAAAAAVGVGYLTRTDDWLDRPRHAKAGNVNNAMFLTEGEFLLILDADQRPDPRILDRTLGYFIDPKVALVQTPQWFSNVSDSDPLGSQAPLFYGPIQQGKDGWNAAFFCGSNAVIRRESLMQLGVVVYVRDVQRVAQKALRATAQMLRGAARAAKRQGPAAVHAIAAVQAATTLARAQLAQGEHVSEVTYAFQQRVDEASRGLVDTDFDAIRADLAVIEQLPVSRGEGGSVTVVDEVALRQLAHRDWSPLGALQSISQMVAKFDVDQGHEAQPMMPLATVSVTEDMATCMRLHGLGWRTVYHHEILAHGLAPDDLGTMLQQRLRWAQGTLQVMLRENPLVQRGLTLGQRFMYLATMWSYLSGFAAVVYLTAPVIYLCLGVLPVQAFGVEFLQHFLPYLVANQLLFFVVGFQTRTWRGLQYSLALFPLWIRACTTAAANVWFRRPLGFVVTPKTRQDVPRFAWRLILPQLVAIAVLVGACVVGIIRIYTGAATSTIGTGVNMAWVAYDLVVLSVVFEAALYRPFPKKELVA